MFKLLVLGCYVGAEREEIKLNNVVSADHNAENKWKWDSAAKKWFCVTTTVTVDPPALLDCLIAPSWSYCRFMHASVTEKDATSVCTRALLVYDWATFSLKLKAYFKKTNSQGLHITN